MLKSIFYARFHPEKGSTVLHQVPEGSVIPCPPSPTAQSPLFDYKSIADYIIPRREFCDRLVAICTNKHRIVGYPVCIHDDEKYQRNEFIFNFCLVLEEEAPYAAYASVIRKLARLFRNLEEQNQFLSVEEETQHLIFAGEEGYGGGSKVYALCEMILEDLNNYCECMIPIDESNTVNLKLFPTRAPPPPIHGWHVPLGLVRFDTLQTSSWDLTVQRVIPHIDGINSVTRIAVLADTDPTLTRRAVAHLLHYGCVCLLDIFQFSAIYAPTAEIAVFFADESMQDECRRYVASPYSPFGKPSGTLSTGHGKGPSTAPKGGSRLNPARSDIALNVSNHGYNSHTTQHHNPPIASRATILYLYSTLRQGLTLRDWCLTHSTALVGIDVRRLITFGKIKGFLYRSHKYAVALRPADVLLADMDDPIANAKMHEKAWRKAAMSSGWQTPSATLNQEDKLKTGAGVAAVDSALEKESQMANARAVDEGGVIVGGEAGVGAGGMLSLGDAAMSRYLDGLHCLDEICTELKMSERDATKKLKKAAGGNLAFFHR